MHKNKKFTKKLAGGMAALLLLTGIGGCGNSTAEDWQSKYQTAAAELEKAEEKIQTLEEGAASPEEIQSYTDRIAELEAQNGAQADELENRQTQIDELWARVDAAQKNLDDAYAKLDAKQNVSASKSSGSGATASAGSSTSNSQTVYITKTGSKYHNAGCQYLRQSKIAISLDDAKAQGYSACSKCF